MATPRLLRMPHGAALTLFVLFVALLASAVAPAAGAVSKRSIALAKPRAHQIIQRGDDGTGVLTLTGSVRGRDAVQARWNSGPWTIVDPHPHGGHFSGVLTGLPAGQGTLSVRLKAHHAVQDSHRLVGVGDIFVIAGQSNACGRAPVMQAWQSRIFTPSMFANDCRWKVLKDPVDNPTGQLDSVSRDHPVRDSGSVWPLLATRIMRGAHVPVAFIPVPYSGSGIADWQCNEAWPDDPSTLYGNMLRRVAKAGGGVRAVLFWQGEWDAGSGQIGESAYEEGLRALAEATQRDLGVRLVVCQIGEIRWLQSTPPAAPFLDGIRAAQLRSWEWSDVAAPGPELYDILLHTATEDRVHYRTPEQLAVVSNRWWCAVAAGCYGAGDGRGPRLTGATYDPEGPSILLQFADDALPLSLPTGDVGAAFTVRDDDGDIAVTVVRTAGASGLRLQLAREAIGALRVSLGEGHLGAVNPVPHDSGRWHLPAELFTDYPVAVL